MRAAKEHHRPFKLTLEGLGSYWREKLTALAGVLLALGYLCGAFSPFDRFLLDSNYALSSRPATDDLLLIEIDRKSLKSLNTWPWPRAFHAALLDRLRHDGAQLIAFDIDFSSAATSSGDRSFAKAIDAAEGKVVLPSIVQNAAAHDGTESADALPIDIFRKGARIGVVNVFPDADGRLRQYHLGQIATRTTQATMVAQMLGDSPIELQSFYIDYSIRPNSIARLSYVDALTGHYDPALVAGRRILIGASALELGDRFAVPLYGFLSGIEVQSLAYESIRQGRAITKLNPAWTVLGLVFIMLLSYVSMSGRWRRALGAGLALVTLVLVLQAASQMVVAISVDTAPLLAAITVSMILAIAREAEQLAKATREQRDIVRRHEALNRSVFSASSDGIMVANAMGMVQTINPAAERMLDRPAAGVIDHPVAIFLPGLGFTVRDGSATQQTQPSLSRELVLSRPAGDEIVLSVVVTKSQLELESVGDGAPSGSMVDIYVITMTDITARRAIESARERTLAELQTAALAKSQFLSSISHELRTPLNSIIGFSSLISQEGLGPVGNPKYASYALDINESGHRLLQLVNDVIDLSRIEAGEYEIKPDTLDLQNLFSNCVHEIQRSANCESRDFICEVGPGTVGAEGDPRALRKAIVNLLSNAVKFTKPTGKITLRALRPTLRKLAIEVEDDGIGIERKMLERIREPFSQASDGFNRKHEGIGIGLNVVNRLVGLHGGTMEISSEPGAGTTVRLIIPVGLAAAGTAA